MKTGLEGLRRRELKSKYRSGLRNLSLMAFRVAGSAYKTGFFMDESAQQRNILQRSIILGTCVAVLGLMFFSEPGLSQSSQLAGARELKLRDEQVREQMIVISRQLGVNCLTCHETDNFKSDKKSEFKISKDHMRIVQVLIDNGMNGVGGQPKADCYMCHRGELKPAYKENFDPLTMGRAKKKEEK